MSRVFILRSAAVVALAACLVPRSAAAQEQTPSAKLLPPTVYAYVSVPDVKELKTRVGDSAFGAMLKDPKLQPTYDQIKDKLNEAGGKVQQNLGVSLDELRKIPTGEMAFAVCDVPGGDIGMIAIIGYGDNGATIDKLIQKAEAEAEKKGGKRSVQQFEGTEIVIYATPAGAAGESDADDLDIEGDDEATPAAGDAAKEVAWFRKDDRLVIGNGAPVLEAVLARWDGSHADTFANNEVFNTIREKTKSDDREPAVVWYFDPIGGLQTALTRAQNIPPQFQIVAGIMPMIGLTNLKAVGGSFDVATSEFDSVGKAFLYVDRPASGNLGLIGVFQFPQAEITPPDWVADTATGYFGANWDVSGAVASVKTLVDTFQGPGAFDLFMQKAENAEKGPKLHPQKDLLDQLSGRVHLVNYPSAAPRTVPQDGQIPAQQPAVVALGVKDEQKMKEVVTKLSQTPDFPGEERQFQGTTIYELPTQAPAGAGPGKMALAISKGNLFFATDTTRMEEVLRGAGDAPLAESDAFKRIADHFPDQASMVGYQDQKDQLKTVYEALRSGKNQQLNEQFDFSVLPAFEDIAKYLRSGGSYAVPDENGALFISFSLKLDE